MFLLTYVWFLVKIFWIRPFTLFSHIQLRTHYVFLLQADYRENRPERVRGVRIREPASHVSGGLRVTAPMRGRTRVLLPRPEHRSLLLRCGRARAHDGRHVAARVSGQTVNQPASVVPVAPLTSNLPPLISRPTLVVVSRCFNRL